MSDGKVGIWLSAENIDLHSKDWEYFSKKRTRGTKY